MKLPRFLILLSTALLLPGCSQKEDYPSHPITFVCPWGAGGGTDQVSRQMAFFLKHELGVECNVINATGGKGVTGHRRGMLARPDGYTVAVITLELNMMHWQGLTTLDYKSAIPLISVNEDAAAIWVRADSPWHTLDELVADVKAKPGRLTASGTAIGGAWHLALAGWLQTLGLPNDAIKWIPTAGAEPSLQELSSGGIDLVCCSLPEADAMYRNGQVRCLGVMAEERAEGYDEIPTFKELGYDWTLVGWRGFAVPNGTPPERVAVLADAMRRVAGGETKVDGKTFPQFMHQRKFNNRFRERDEFVAFLKENDAKFGKLLTSKAFATLSQSQFDAYVFPRVLFGVLFVLAVALAFQRAMQPTPPVSADEEGTPPDVPVSRADGWINVALAVGFVVAYWLFSADAGFLIMMATMVGVLCVRLKAPLISSLAAIVVVIPAVYYLFAHILLVPLPRGWWGW